MFSVLKSAEKFLTLAQLHYILTCQSNELNHIFRYLGLSTHLFVKVPGDSEVTFSVF